MSRDAPRPKAYIREGCPFSFKFLVFMTEAGLLDRIDVVRLRPDDPGFEEAKQRLSEHLGKSATFPTVEVEPGRYMTDSDRLIEHFAEREDLQPESMPVLSFYKQTIFPKLIELHKIKTGSAKA
ncbi:MAG TPA: glutathione S-transferase N-terminal domain-containing protein [Gammaproteobacteria bacterium]|nr:glutathione S-transferase N-terminal domain-containing protein [Gammaproteobacteria bacterium]